MILKQAVTQPQRNHRCCGHLTVTSVSHATECLVRKVSMTQTACWLIYMRQADVKLQPALTVTFQCFGYINVRNSERPKSALGNSLQCFFAFFFFYKIQTQKGSKECLFIMTWTQYLYQEFCCCFHSFE